MLTAILVGESPVRLWGLTGRERLERQLRSLGVARITDGPEEASTGKTLVFRADHVFELRALRGLLGLEGLLVHDGAPVAAHVAGADAGRAVAALEQADGESGLATFGVEDLQAFERDLRKSEPPLVARITDGNRARLEDKLYGASYKGITDFVTKWWWPRPARAGVRWCARLGLTPNMVTTSGFIMMLAACWLFYQGQYGAGLALGWLMTYLDTVDGKLARVTVKSSRFGHFLDHGMDIVHPPFWYLLWGMSLVDFQPVAGIGQSELYIAIFAGYIGGRLIEAIFNFLGDTSIFAWRPFDAYFRLYTARRNPCLVLLTVSWAVGSPATGLWLVAGWTILSTMVMSFRLAYALRVRVTEGRLRSWLAEPDAARRYPRAYASFSATRRAYG